MSSTISHPPVTPAQPYTPSRWLRWLYRRFFSHIRLDPQWSAAVQEAAERGTVVYVLRSLSFLDFLCLDFLVKRLGLPLIRFANDLGLWILEPFGKGERRLRRKRQVPEDLALRRTLQDGHSALLFLRKPPRIGRASRKGERLQVDLLRTLLEAQRQSTKPILLVPQTFVWSKLPARHKPSWIDLLFGPSDHPGKLRVLFQFLLNFRNVQLRSGEPFDLADFLRQQAGLSDSQAADKVRIALLRRIERERVLVLGPMQKGPARLQDELLRSQRLRRSIEAEARVSQKSVAKVEQDARRMLRRLCANQKSWALAIYHRLLDVLWRRIYDGLEIDRPGLERLRDAARRGALIIAPSHKSHVDYLVLSDVFYANALIPPLIAAGDNLSFWPLGPALRRAGAFFIRRSFRGSKLYPALVDAYLRKLLLEGFAIEFFIEGGRSRTGKLLEPKLGLLSMLVDAGLLLSRQPIFFAPVSITYDRVVEQSAYVQELRGGKKKRESLGTLLKTPSVLLSRYGRLYVQVGEIIPFDALLREVRQRYSGRCLASSSPSAEQATSGELGAAERRAVVKHLAQRLIYEMRQVTTVTAPSLAATVLLAYPRRALAIEEVAADAQRLLDVLRHRQARIAPAVCDARGTIRLDAIEQAMRLFLDAGWLVEESQRPGSYGVRSDKRLELEYHKNNILHFFAERCLVALALANHAAEGLPESVLLSGVTRWADLLRYEFPSDASRSLAEELQETLVSMQARGEVQKTAPPMPQEGESHWIMGDAGLLTLYRRMLAPYVEVHCLLLASLQRRPWTASKAEDAGKRALQQLASSPAAKETPYTESFSQLKLQNAWAAWRDLGLLPDAPAWQGLAQELEGYCQSLPRA